MLLLHDNCTCICHWIKNIQYFVAEIILHRRFVDIVSQCLGSIHIGLGIVYEQALLGLGTKLFQYGKEDIAVGFGHVHLLREEEVVEVLLCLAPEMLLGNMHPVRLVGVGQEMHLVALCPQLPDKLQFAGRYVQQAVVPCLQHLLGGGAGVAELLYAGNEVLCGDISRLIQVHGTVCHQPVA